MTRLAPLTLVALFLGGCSTADYNYGLGLAARALDEKVDSCPDMPEGGVPALRKLAKQDIAPNLRNPSRARYRFEEPVYAMVKDAYTETAYNPSGDGCLVYLPMSVNAPNAFGGMTGWRDTAVFWNGNWTQPTSTDLIEGDDFVWTTEMGFKVSPGI